MRTPEVMSTRPSNQELLSELRERSKKERPKIDEQKESSPAIRADISDLLGLTSEDMHDIVVSDIVTMIKKGYRTALEGYVLCLSRIVRHDTAWGYIVEAFRETHEKVPGKYYPQFGRNPDEPPPLKKGMIVQ